MGQNDIRKALYKHLIDAGLSLPLGFPNSKFTEPTEGPCGLVTLTFNQPSVATIGDSGEDNHDGFLQVLLKYPTNEGDNAIMAMADTLRPVFKAGTRCVYNDQVVNIVSCGVNGTPQIHDAKLVLPITINWYARTRR